MLRRERLTQQKIAAFTCPPEKQQVFLWDSEAPRLAVRATAGAKSFIFETKLDKRTIRRTIGAVQAWTLEAARNEARRLQTLVDQGKDPRELDREAAEAKAAAKAAKEASKAAQEAAKRYSLRALCDAYVATLEANGKARSAAATRSAFKCHVFSHEDIAGKPANQVTPHQIAAMVRKVREAGKERAAGILRSYLSAAFNAAKRAPFDSAMPADLIPFAIEHNPVDPIPAIASNRGQRTLSAEEVKAYLAALGDSLADTALKLALYAGGQRMAQLLRAKVSDYTHETQTLRLWDGKGKRREPREHLLPLAPVAAGIVENLITRAKEREADRAKEEGREPAFSGLWLFSTHGRVAMTFETPGIRAAEISATMKGEPFNLRDIRRTVETKLAALGISKDTRAQLLSHGLSGVQSAHYDRHTYADEKRAALTAWEARLEEIRTGKKAGNVTRMPRKRAA